MGKDRVPEPNVREPPIIASCSIDMSSPPSMPRTTAPRMIPVSGATSAFMKPRGSSTSSARATWLIGIRATRYARPWPRASFSLNPMRPSCGSMKTV